jgi:hypothetical protein
VNLPQVFVLECISACSHSVQSRDVSECFRCTSEACWKEIWNFHKRRSGCVASHTGSWYYCCPWLPHISSEPSCSLGVGIAQLVLRLAKGWMAQVLFWAGQDFSPLHSVQTGSGAHPASCLMGSRGMKLTAHLHLVPKSRMVELYLHSPYVLCCYISPFDMHVCLCWWVVFFTVVCCAECLVFE